MLDELKTLLVGKTIANIERPDELEVGSNGKQYDDNILVTFSDGTTWKLASWDYEGYASGIYEDVEIK